MSQVEITVRGQHSAFEAPERGTAHVTITLEGPQEAAVHAGVAGALRAVTERVQPLHHPDRGPVTWWSNDQLRTWARRPHHKDGKQLPLVFFATTDVRAKFRDFAALSRWLSDVLAITGVRLDRVEWALTEARRQELTRLVRAQAVREAQTKAQAYADALSLGSVTAIALADAGMLGEGLVPQTGHQAVAFARGAAAVGGTEIAFFPQDIEVSAAVDARFLVG